MTCNHLWNAALPWLALAACSHETPFPQGQPDAAVDAAVQMGDAPANAVTVAITLAGLPARGVTVVFQNADSSVARVVATDANGTAGVVLAANGFVTVIEPQSVSGPQHLDSFAGVQPGDLLHLDVAPAGPTSVTAVSVSAPPYTGAGSAASYVIDTSCGKVAFAAGAGSGSAQLLGCGSTVDAFVIAEDDTGAALGAFFQAAIPFDGMLSGSYAPEQTVTFTYTNVPPSIASVVIDHRIATANGTLLDTTASANVANGSAKGSAAEPVPVGATGIVISDALPNAGGVGEQRVYDWSSWSSTYALDVAQALLPPFASAPMFASDAHAVSWTETAGVVTADFVRVGLQIDRPTGRNTDTAWTWRMIAPRSSTPALAFPVLPSIGNFDFNPAATDTVSVNELTTVQLPGGYAAFRSHGFGTLDAAVNGASGRAVVESLFMPML